MPPSCISPLPISVCLAKQRNNYFQTVCECLCEGSRKHCPKPAFRPCSSPSDENCVKSLEQEKKERVAKYEKKGPAHSTDCRHHLRFRRRGAVDVCACICERGEIDYKDCDVPQFINYLPRVDDFSWRLTKIPCNEAISKILEKKESIAKASKGSDASRKVSSKPKKSDVARKASKSKKGEVEKKLSVPKSDFIIEAESGKSKTGAIESKPPPVKGKPPVAKGSAGNKTPSTAGSKPPSAAGSKPPVGGKSPAAGKSPAGSKSPAAKKPAGKK